MDPNSTHQIWSLWHVTVHADPQRPAPDDDWVRDNCARFYRKLFGAASELRIDHLGPRWDIQCRSEGHPVHDPQYVAYVHAQLNRFLRNGYGLRATITFTPPKLEAGSRDDGRPPDQLILGPPPVVLDNSLGWEK